MKTLKQFINGIAEIPAITAWSLAELAEMRGRQDLYVRQAPQKLKALREHALIESAVSSNRIEGVEVDHNRVREVVLGHQLLRDRDEEEVRGYRNALDWIHSSGRNIPVSSAAMLALHKHCRGQIWDAGKLKEKDGDIIERLPSGETRVRFRTVSAIDTPAALAELDRLWNELLAGARIHPVIVLAAHNLDFLCIHPFRDGNGRVSRLLMLLQLYHLGYEVGRYISIERLIEQNKERYYETLELSSQGWHEGRHDPWPYIGYVLFILKETYREFERRLGNISAPKGAKTAMVVEAVKSRPGAFTVQDIQAECPGVGIDTIRNILKYLQKTGGVKCTRMGRSATWQAIN